MGAVHPEVQEGSRCHEGCGQQEDGLDGRGERLLGGLDGSRGGPGGARRDRAPDGVLDGRIPAGSRDTVAAMSLR
jgi:hypothetical protein